ncbi:MAG: hypothetical protein WB800_07380, partial [Streptosporangiaceae bacterium]
MGEGQDGSGASARQNEHGEDHSSHQRPDEGRGPALPAHGRHHLIGDDAAEDQDTAHRQVDTAGDDDEGHPDTENRQDRG